MFPYPAKVESPKEIELAGRNGRLFVRAWGNPNGKPYLGLHGWLDNAGTFDRLAPLLPDIYLVSLDFPGHGLSDHLPPGSIYHVTDAILEILGVAKALNWDRFSILGHSMGGVIGALFAAALPDRLLKLALIESLGPLTEPDDKAASRLQHFVHDYTSLPSKRLPVYPTIEDACKARVSAGDIKMESARVLASRGTREVEGGFTWRSDPRLRLSTPIRMTEAQVYSLLRAIKCPTLLVRADKGLLEPIQFIDLRIQCVKNIVHDVVPGGHHVHLDSPEAVAPKVKNFV